MKQFYNLGHLTSDPCGCWACKHIMEALVHDELWLWSKHSSLLRHELPTVRVPRWKRILMRPHLSVSAHFFFQFKTSYHRCIEWNLPKYHQSISNGQQSDSSRHPHAHRHGSCRWPLKECRDEYLLYSFFKFNEEPRSIRSGLQGDPGSRPFL